MKERVTWMLKWRADGAYLVDAKPGFYAYWHKRREKGKRFPTLEAARALRQAWCGESYIAIVRYTKPFKAFPTPPPAVWVNPSEAVWALSQPQEHEKGWHRYVLAPEGE